MSFWRGSTKLPLSCKVVRTSNFTIRCSQAISWGREGEGGGGRGRVGKGGEGRGNRLTPIVTAATLAISWGREEEGGEMGQLPVTPANLSKATQMVKIAVTHPDYIESMKEFTPLLFPQVSY